MTHRGFLRWMAIQHRSSERLYQYIFLYVFLASSALLKPSEEKVMAESIFSSVLNFSKLATSAVSGMLSTEKHISLPVESFENRLLQSRTSTVFSPRTIFSAYCLSNFICFVISSSLWANCIKSPCVRQGQNGAYLMLGQKELCQP